jgi:precorrin-8X/cobalt-precorrin-8 methylmutase
MVEILQIAPQDIEAESFRIIEKELGPTSFTTRELAVVKRCIHATGDFSFAETIRFHDDAITAGIQAIQAGKNILIDVNMGASGISKTLLARLGGTVICHINEEKTAAMAKQNKTTRSDAAIERAINENIGIVAVGNAPTALLRTMALIDQKLFAPDLVIGAPVGFVNAAESKELLSQQTYPHIVALGRKGGTPVAVATVNALIRLALEK